LSSEGAKKEAIRPPEICSRKRRRNTPQLERYPVKIDRITAKAVTKAQTAR
jgi:hypothetical protein